MDSRDSGARAAPQQSIRTGPGYGITLAEALVTEGLADHFVAEAFPDTPPQPWDHALSAEQETRALAKGASDLQRT